MTESNNTPETTQDTPYRFNMRGFFSLLLFGAFVLMTLSGIGLYIAPRGSVARGMEWTFLALTRDDWTAIHSSLSVLALIATGFHLYYNWTVFWQYIKRKAQAAINLKWELAVALVICAVTFLGTLWAVPPFHLIEQWNEDIKAYWDARGEEEGLSRGSGRGMGRGGGGGAGGRSHQ